MFSLRNDTNFILKGVGCNSRLRQSFSDHSIISTKKFKNIYNVENIDIISLNEVSKF